MPFDKQYSYLPPIPSPLNPDAYYDFPSRLPPTTPTKPQQHSPRPRTRQSTSPNLSYAQHILRAKAAEAWRTEHLRRIAREAHSPPSKSSDANPWERGGADVRERDVADCPLTRAALDMYPSYTPSSNGNSDSSSAGLGGTAVDLEGSLGLDPISYHPGMEEKPAFGLLQPFTVDLSAVTGSQEYPPQATGDGRTEYRKIARRVLLMIGLLCLSYCLLPGIRYRAGLRQGVAAVNS
ncbi:hypothetical protein GE09DRAFT_530488 [Coniochaeta sp. 2T2.1]|nr:hypothetical protein GE09DRAFT_530488 [Coniochaeta sp. 2T2.1]